MKHYHVYTWANEDSDEEETLSIHLSYEGAVETAQLYAEHEDSSGVSECDLPLEECEKKYGEALS